MPFISDSTTGWKINQINSGPPYKVALVGPYKFPQVQDARGTVALSGPSGSVFCGSVEQAEELRRQANAGNLTKQQ